MKKLKLFISLWFTMFSMVVFGQAEYEKIAITANTQDNSALKVNVQSSSNEINWKYIKDFQKEKEYLSTGLIKSGVISINGDNTKYNVSAGIGIITNFDDPENPTSTIVNFPAVVAKTPSYLTTSNITYVAINSSGTVTESATPFTPEQRRTLIILGAVIHSNLTNINVVNNISAPTNASTNQLHDLMEAIGALNLSGNKFGPNNTNLLMNKSAGTIFKLGSNFVNDWKNPHVLGQSALTGLTFRYRTQNGTEGSDVTSINPNVYDLNNVLTAVPSNRYSIQTITLFQTGLVRIQYGQETYGSLSEAEAAISTRSYNVESNIALNGITRAYLLVKEGTTSLANTADAKFVDAGKFGSITSGGGAITLASIIAALGYTPENDANKQNSLATDGSGVKYPTVDAVNTKVSNIDNTSDLNKPISTATQTALNLKENTANKNIANGYAGLGSDGKLISSQLPSITITDTFVVGSQSEMLSLVAETGDVAVRTDVNKSFILQGDTPSDLADWQELLTPTSAVSSVFGRQGAVTSNSGDYTADQISETASRKFQTLAQQTYNDATSSIQTQLNSKATDSNVVHKTGDETISGRKTFNSSTDTGVRSNNSGSGYGIYSENASNGFGLYVANNGSGKAIKVANALGSFGYMFEGSYNGNTNFYVNSQGGGYFSSYITADSGLSLKQDSGLGFASGYTTIDTDSSGLYLGLTSSKLAYLNLNNITTQRNFNFPNIGGTFALGTGVANYLARWSDSNVLGISLISDNATNVGIGEGTIPTIGRLFVKGIDSQPNNTITVSTTDYSQGSVGSILTMGHNGGSGSTTGIFRNIITGGTTYGDIAFPFGKVGIGTTSPSTLLYVKGNSLYNGHISVDNSSTTGGGIISVRQNGVTSGLMSTAGSILGNTSRDLALFAETGLNQVFFTNDTERMRITSSGSVVVNNLGTGLVYSNAGALTSTNPSDERLKDNITDLQYGLNEILKLRPVSYDWKNDKINQGKQFGFIAQEVQEVMPQLVKEFKTKDGENEVTRLGLDKEGIYAALVNAIKEQQAQIKELKAELELLKNK